MLATNRAGIKCEYKPQILRALIGVNLREAVGIRFARSVDGGKSAAYKELSTTKEKADFRMRWAAAEYEKLKATKSKLRNYKKIDASKGKYMSFARIVKLEGGDDEAITAARNYVDSCLKMKGDWLKWNCMTKRVDYLYMEHEVSDIFEKSWSMYEEDQKKHAASEKQQDATAEDGGSKKEKKAHQRKPRRQSTNLRP